MNCLFVGAGAVADEYAATLSESRLDLAGVCDTDPERADRLADRHDARSFVDLAEALDGLDASLVVNLTSHAAHAPVTRRCLTDGRHVYSEKPLALDPDTAADLLTLAAEGDRGLACAPINPTADPQTRAGRALADGRLGTVRLCQAHAHVGRVTDWHDRPDSFLAVGPLYDGGVYPLTLLVAYFGPVERVRVADSFDLWPARETAEPTAPTHLEATLSFACGPIVRLTASFYVSHRSREFYGLEVHGDDGRLYLRDAGALTATDGDVSVGGLGREYTPMPPQRPVRGRTHLEGVERFAASLADGDRPRETARRGAHVVAVCDAIERAASAGGPVPVPDCTVSADPVPRPVVRPATTPRTRTDESGGRRSIRLPPIGFGCSRYRDGEYVDRVDSIATALDAGYRLLDSAELYGNEHRIGRLLATPGAPDRRSLFVLGKVWNTNHGHVREACAGSLAELGIDAFDCYALHWPEAWAYQGPLDRLAEKPVERQERLTFPDSEGEIETADVSLTEAWANLEAVHDRGLTRTLGLCNVSRAQIETVLDAGTVPPAVVQIERHPYRPRTDLVAFCHERGIRVIAHSPLSAPGLLDEPVLEAIAADRGRSPAAIALAWNASAGAVPIPSSTTDAHVVANLRAGSIELADDELDRIATLEDPEFER